MHAPPLSRSMQRSVRGACWTRARRPAFCGRPLPRYSPAACSASASSEAALGYCGVGVDDVGQVVARAGLVEPLHRGVEARPELGWAAAAGPGSQFVRRTRSFGVSDGPPCQSCLERSVVGVAHRGRRVSERSQSIAKAGVGRRLLVGAHRAAPRCPRVVDRRPRVFLRTRGRCPGPLVRQLAHAAVLSHPRTVTRRASPFNPLLANETRRSPTPTHGRTRTVGVASALGTGHR